MDKIRKIKFPDLLLDKQDKSDKYGYHWVETTYKGHRTQVCVLLKEEGGLGYYLPLNAPYELRREDNYPRENFGNYVIQSSEPEYKVLMKTVPDSVFMPTLEYCNNNVSPKEWFDAFITICTEFPEKIDHIAMFSFMVTSENELYNGYYLICHPFVNFIKDKNGKILYNNKHNWLEGTSNIKIDGDYVNHTGNVFFYKKEYMEEFFGGRLLPIIKSI